MFTITKAKTLLYLVGIVLFIFICVFMEVYKITWKSGDYHYYYARYQDIRGGKLINDNPLFFIIWVGLSILIRENSQNPIFSLKLIAFVSITSSVLSLIYLIYMITKSANTSILSGVVYLLHEYTTRNINSGNLKAVMANIFVFGGMISLIKYFETKKEEYFILYINFYILSIYTHTFMTIILMFYSIPYLIYGFKKGKHTQLTQICSLLLILIALTLFVLGFFAPSMLPSMLHRFYKVKLICYIGTINVDELDLLLNSWVYIFTVFSILTSYLFIYKLKDESKIFYMLNWCLGVIFILIAITVKDKSAVFRFRRELKIPFAISLSKQIKHKIYWLVTFYIILRGLLVLYQPAL